MIDIIGFVLLIVFAVFAYKTAKEYERNPFVWALISFAVGFCIQIILPASILAVFTVAAMMGGSTTEQIGNKIPFATISITFIFLSIISGFLIVRHLAKMPEEKEIDAPPVPPSDFN